MQCFCLQPSLTCAKLTYFSTDFSVQYSNVTTAVWDSSHSGKSLSFRNRKSWTLAVRYRRYGRPIAATAGIFVLQDACCIHAWFTLFHNALKFGPRDFATRVMWAPQLSFQSDLGRRADSRWALPQISSLCFYISEKISKFAASIKRPKAESVSASGGLCPLTPWPGALPLDPAGGFAPRPPL